MVEENTIDDEIILADLPDDELTAQMHDDLYDGLADEIAEGTNLLLGRGWDPSRVLNDALVEGMRVVGIDFRDGILFVPEVLLAANAMKAGMAILRPLLAETGAKPIGKVVIGTVKGDIHDIGKNLVAMMLEGAGFEVINLGINTDVEEFLGALDEHKPDILGMSALLTTTMPYMKVVIDTLIEQLIKSVSRTQLNQRTRALDRALLWNFYVIPHWHIRADRILYWDKFSRPSAPIRSGVMTMRWWYDPLKAAALQKARQ